MVCLALRTAGIFLIERVDGKLYATSYSELVSGAVCAAIHAAQSTDILLHKDYASPPGARSTLENFQAAEIRTLPWPALRPDINPDENVWAILLRRATADARRYHSEDELWRAIKHEVRQIPHTPTQELIAGVPRRLTALLERQGAYAQ
jgi:hypothetical protein